MVIFNYIMKNKFRYKYDFLSFILPVTILLIVCAITIVINVLKLFDLPNFPNANVVMEITCIAVALLGITVALCCLFGKYKITDKLLLKFGPIDCMRGKYKIDNIIKIVQSSDENKLYVNVYVKDEPKIILINIRQKDFEDFVKCIKNKNPKVLFDKTDIEEN